MSEALEVRAEILKLGRLLGRDAGELSYLDGVPADDLRALREQVTDVLFGAQGHALGRLAAASKLLPVGLVATIGQHAFGPVLSARITGMLDPDRASDVAARLPITFLADVAVELDPRRASDVIARIPPARIAEISAELIRREEYVTMGRFVGHLHADAIAAAVAVIDDRSMLRVAFVLESKAVLPTLVDLLAPERLDAIIDAAVEDNLWPEALDLLGHLPDDRRSALADRAIARADGVLDSLVDSVMDNDLWDVVLTLAREMPEDELHRITGRLADQVAGLDPAQREQIAVRAQAAGLLDRLGPLTEVLVTGS